MRVFELFHLYIVSTMLFATFNCCGLRTMEKVDHLRNTIEQYKLSILFLQETHVDFLQLGKQIARKLNGDSFWSLGTAKSRGHERPQCMCN